MWVLTIFRNQFKSVPTYVGTDLNWFQLFNSIYCDNCNKALVLIRMADINVEHLLSQFSIPRLETVSTLQCSERFQMFLLNCFTFI